LLSICGKPAAVKDLTEFSAALAELTTADPSELISIVRQAYALNRQQRKPPAAKNAPIRPQIVAVYLRKLEVALGDDTGFKSEMAALEQDKELTSPEVLAIAKQFSLKISKSKSTALKNIWARHKNLMISRAKSTATAGRIAG